MKDPEDFQFLLIQAQPPLFALHGTPTFVSSDGKGLGSMLMNGIKSFVIYPWECVTESHAWKVAFACGRHFAVNILLYCASYHWTKEGLLLRRVCKPLLFITEIVKEGGR
jgi:hypothetical protein